MDRVAAGDHRGADHRRLVQVALPRLGRTDADRLVGQAHGQRVAIGLAVGDHGRQAEVAAGAQDAHRDLTAVGDEDLADHGSTDAGAIATPRGRQRPSRARRRRSRSRCAPPARCASPCRSGRRPGRTRRQRRRPRRPCARRIATHSTGERTCSASRARMRPASVSGSAVTLLTTGTGASRHVSRLERVGQLLGNAGHERRVEGAGHRQLQDAPRARGAHRLLGRGERVAPPGDDDLAGRVVVGDDQLGRPADAVDDGLDRGAVETEHRRHAPVGAGAGHELRAARHQPQRRRRGRGRRPPRAPRTRRPSARPPGRAGARRAPRAPGARRPRW